MASVFYQTIMFLLFCSTWVVSFLATWTNYESIYKAICVASILWSTFLFALTEGLSHFKAITASNLIIAWGIFLIIVGWGVIFREKILIRNKINFLKRSLSELYRIDTPTKCLLIFIAFFMIARTVLATMTAPHEVDTNSYHLPRIIFWIQHQSVDYYDTLDLRQLFSPVFGEYVNLNVFLITGGDLFSNMFQNFSAYGCVILVYGILRNLGCGVKWALFGCILAMSMNIFSAESISSQVDLAGAFYLMILVYLIIEVFYDDSRLTIFQFMLLGLACGLIYITKTNSCAPAAVIIIYVVIARLFKKDFKILPLGIISLIFIGLIVSTTFYRNYQAFDGDFMAKINVGNISIGAAEPRYVFVNIVKNLITLGFQRNAELTHGGIRALGKVLKVNIDDPKINLTPESPFSYKYSLHMDWAGAHIVTFLFVITVIISLIYLVKRRTKTDGLMFALTAQVFSILIILRWQPWGSRLMFPALVVVVIPIVYYFSEITKRFAKTSWKYKACYFLVLYFVFESGICSLEGLAFHGYIGVNSLRHPRYWGIVTRTQPRFTAHQDFERLIDNGYYENIGLEGEDIYQYPILAKYVPMGKHVECVHLQGNGRDVKAMNQNFEPDIILVDGIELDVSKIYTCNKNNYECVYNFDNFSAWVKQ